MHASRSCHLLPTSGPYCLCHTSFATSLRLCCMSFATGLGPAVCHLLLAPGHAVCLSLKSHVITEAWATKINGFSAIHMPLLCTAYKRSLSYGNIYCSAKKWYITFVINPIPSNPYCNLYFLTFLTSLRMSTVKLHLLSNHLHCQAF